MISEISIDKEVIKRTKGHLLPYISECKNVPEHLVLDKGLTLVVGPNGSGKTALLYSVAAGSACLSGRQEISDRALFDYFGFDNEDRLDGVSVSHDGQVFYLAPSVDALSRGNGDYLAPMLVQRAARSRSSGEFVLNAISDVIQLLAQVVTPHQFFDLDAEVEKAVSRRKYEPDENEMKKITQKVVEKFSKKGMSPVIRFPEATDLIKKGFLDFNKTWQYRYEHFKARYFDPKIPRSKPTLILDEPDRHLSLPMQAKLWSLLLDPLVIQSFQIVVATHSLFAFSAIKSKRASVIEMENGFVNSVLNVLPGLEK
ncbi:ATP-binding protein [Sulfuricystis multivorans]|uniref:ATP-binding protein n=1 Tax=Sulfuricystis multivorans TaxID=2211108 RepID=UPI000F834314|nr:ATP-binding protein [Sulfuricystis multivorans]